HITGRLTDVTQLNELLRIEAGKIDL
ncbi:MAG: hypothetical protein RLZZ619_1309, partial [Pseudomonadota bacterium]